MSAESSDRGMPQTRGPCFLGLLARRPSAVLHHRQPAAVRILEENRPRIFGLSR
jgi:hypothetical protein